MLDEIVYIMFEIGFLFVIGIILSYFLKKNVLQGIDTLKEGNFKGFLNYVVIIFFYVFVWALLRYLGVFKLLWDILMTILGV